MAIDHSAEALAIITTCGGDAVTRAHVHATLALVEQQRRTADLLDLVIQREGFALQVEVREQ